MTWEIFIICMTAIICGTIFLCLPILYMFMRSLQSRRSKSLSEDEGKMLHEIAVGLRKMRERMENLETILGDRTKERQVEERR